MVAQWEVPPRAIETAWEGPDGTVAALAQVQPEALAVVIGPPGGDGASEWETTNW